MSLDFPDGHAPGVHGYDLVVEALEAPLTLFDQLRLEGALAVAGDRYLHLAVLPFDFLLAVAVRVLLAARLGFWPFS